MFLYKVFFACKLYTKINFKVTVVFITNVAFLVVSSVAVLLKHYHFRISLGFGLILEKKICVIFDHF